MKVFFIFQQTPKLYPFSTRENIFFPAKNKKKTYIYLFPNYLGNKFIFMVRKQLHRWNKKKVTQLNLIMQKCEQKNIFSTYFYQIWSQSNKHFGDSRFFVVVSVPCFLSVDLTINIYIIILCFFLCHRLAQQKIECRFFLCIWFDFCVTPSHSRQIILRQ